MRKNKGKGLTVSVFDTPLGKMRAYGDDKALYHLSFVDKTSPKHLKETNKTSLTAPLISIKKELKQYFEGKLKVFKTPMFLEGTEFQKKVWQALKKLPFGETKSYSELAKSISKPKAFRAVANAVGANPLCVIIPCHRIIQLNGEIGGYAGGIKRKKWLLNHEAEEARFGFKFFMR